MAFKNVPLAADGTLQTVYTVPSGYEAVVHAIFITPKVASTYIDLKAGGGYIGYRIPLVLGGTLYYPKPANLEATDTIQFLADNSGDAEIFISILEQVA